MSLPAPDGSQPKWLPVGRPRTGQCEKTKVVHMRETNHGRVGVTHTGVLGDGRDEIRPGCGVGTTFTGDPSRSPAEVGRGRAAGVTLVGDPSRGRLTGRAPGVALTGDLSRGQSDNGLGREPQPTLTGDSVSLAGAWGRGLPDRWHGRGSELVFTGDPGRGLADVVHGRGIRVVLTDDSSRGHAKNGNGRGSGLVHLGDLDRGHSFASTHDRVLGPGDAPTGGPTGARAAVVLPLRMTARSGTPPQAPRAAVVHSQQGMAAVPGSPSWVVPRTAAMSPKRDMAAAPASPSRGLTPPWWEPGAAAMSIQGMAAILDSVHE